MASDLACFDPLGSNVEFFSMYRVSVLISCCTQFHSLSHRHIVSAGSQRRDTCAICRLYCRTQAHLGLDRSDRTLDQNRIKLKHQQEQG